MDINNLFCLISEKELNAISNDINQLKIENMIDLNNISFLNFLCTKKHDSHFNLLEKETLLDYRIESDENLVLLAPINGTKKNFWYDIYYPYSMRQAHFLYKYGLNKDVLIKFYDFTFEEIKEGIAIREGLKNEFYPLSHEDNQEGVYHFNKRILGLPEFF